MNDAEVQAATCTRVAIGWQFANIMSARPQMGGRDMAQSLSATHPDMKALFMSGYVSNLSELLTDGCAFIGKPFTPEALLRKVREVLDRERSQPRAA